MARRSSQLRVGAAILLAATGCGRSEPSPTGAPPPLSCVAPEFVPKPTTAWPCPPGAAVRAIQSAVDVVFEGDPTAGTLVCRESEGSADLTRLQERVFQALHLMRRRHADNRHPHSCGASADNTIAELGAYGVQYQLNIGLAEHSLLPRLSADERRYSASRAALMRHYSFCR